MEFLKEARRSPWGRLLLALSGVGAGAAAGFAVGALGIVMRWPGAWGLPPEEAGRLLLQACVPVGITCGALAGVVLAGNPWALGFVLLAPGSAILLNEVLGVGAVLPRGLYLALAIPGLSVPVSLLVSLLPPLRREPFEESTWWFRAVWASLRGRRPPTLPSSILRLHDKWMDPGDSDPDR